VNRLRTSPGNSLKKRMFRWQVEIYPAHKSKISWKIV
jgi:hypothetical protein